MAGAVDRIGAELDTLSTQVAALIVERVPEYQDDRDAREKLEPFVRQNADQAMRVLRGIPTTTAAARNFALTNAIATGLSFAAIEATFTLAKATFVQRLRELADNDEDLTDPLTRLDEAHAMVINTMRVEYLDVKERLQRD